jgi:hypothetical protein
MLLFSLYQIKKPLKGRGNLYYPITTGDGGSSRSFPALVPVGTAKLMDRIRAITRPGVNNFFIIIPPFG